MTRRLAAPCAAVLLAGPTVLAFFSGGYFDLDRQWAGLVAWALVALLALGAGRALPRGRAAWLAVGGLAALAGWTLLSTVWAPIAGDSWAAGQRVVLYVGLLLAAALVASDATLARWIEPALAAGAVIVIGYGISERLLPGLLHFTRDPGSQGRLEQPLTYWNAMGELAAIGLVLVARISGDPDRRPALRRLAVLSTGVLGLGLSLSVSRGALFAAAAGLVCLLVVAPTLTQLRALGLAVAGAVLAGLAAAPFSGVGNLAGSLSTREGQGAIVLAALVLIAALGLLVHERLQRRPDRALALPRRAPALALVLICAGLAVAIAAGAHENTSAPLSGSASRLVTLQSDRYDYWRVAVKAFASQPLHGVGAEGWAVDWLRYRRHHVGAQDAHSLPLQTLAELGLVGVALLLALIAGVALSARRALARAGSLAAGPIAACVAYLAHSPLDWDWQMPALTAVAVILAGTLVALGAREPAGADAPADRAGAPARGRPSWAAAGIATLSVLACAWFVLAIGATQAEDRVDAVLSAGAHSPAVVAAGLSDLDRAAVLNPDRAVLERRASLLFSAGAHRTGLRMAETLVADEPENANWWSLLSFMAQGRAPAEYRLAQSRLRTLVPPVSQ